MYNSGPHTNAYLDLIHNTRRGIITDKLLSSELGVTTDYKEKADASIDLLPGLMAQIAQCKKDLEASNAEAADYIKTNLYIEEGVRDGTLVIRNGTLKHKTQDGGQKQKNKSKKPKSKKTKKRKYKRSK